MRAPVTVTVLSGMSAVLAVAISACPAAKAEGGPEAVVAYLLPEQQADSARIVFRWTPQPVDPDQLPVEVWESRIVSVAGDTLAIGGTSPPATRDTLAIPWPALPDSVQVVVHVRGVDSDGREGAWGLSNVVTVKLSPRAPSAPDVQVDSVGGQPQAEAAIVLPQDIVLAGIGSDTTVCAFKVFTSGHIARRRGALDGPLCEDLYLATFTAEERAVTQAEQDWEDQACWTWTSSNPVAVSVQPHALCGATARVVGLQYTAAPPNPLDGMRWVSSWQQDLGPVGVVDQNGLATCLRPGTFEVVADHPVHGQAVAVITCEPPPMLAFFRP